MFCMILSYILLTDGCKLSKIIKELIGLHTEFFICIKTKHVIFENHRLINII